MILILLFMNVAMALSIEHTISGKVEKTEGCSGKVMVWLSLDKENYKERLLLMHTEVPVGGSFKFYVRPGKYQVRASDESGCEYFQRVSGVQEPVLKVKMVKK